MSKQQPANLFLYRSLSIRDSAVAHWTSTDVWVFSDVGGFKSFARTIQAAMRNGRAARNRTITSDLSMRMLVMPPLSKPTKVARLRIFERVVATQHGIVMELILLGNAPAYRRLLDYFDWQLANGVDRPLEHLHVDAFDDAWVLHPSVNLNLRGPVRVWSAEFLGTYWSLLDEENPHQFPVGERELRSVERPNTLPRALPNYWLGE